MESSSQESQADSTDKYYLEEAVSAGDAQWLFNLNSPKSKEGIEESEATSTVRKEHYCADCDKSFSSGKALGGHMSSAHVQAGKDYPSKKLRLKNSTKFKHRGSASSVGGGAKKIFCEICGKDFPSRKSLYGHMRCHPEREYRGMQVPVDAKKTNLPSFASDASDDVDKSSMEVKSLHGHMRCMQLPVDAKKTNLPSFASDASDDDDVDKSSMEVKETSPSFATSPSVASYYDYDDVASDYDYDDECYDQIDAATMDSPVVDLTKFLTSWAVTGQRGRQAQNPGIGSPRDPPLSSAEAQQLNEVLNFYLNGVPLDSRHKEEDKSEEDEDMSCNSISLDAPNAEIVVVKPMRIGGTKKQRKEVYPAKKAQDFPVKPITIGETNPNADADCYKAVERAPKSDADCYKDVERAPKSKRQRIEGSPAKDKRQFSPVKKLIIGERKPEGQILQGASYEGKGKAPLEPKFREFPNEICESENKDCSIRSEDNNNRSADSKKTPEKQNQKYVENRKKNGFEAYKKRLEKPLSTKTETNLSPVAERKDAITEFTPDKYKCSTCDKSFSSHQALGGHRSSHNKFKMSIQNIIDDSSSGNQSNSISQILEAREGSTPGLRLAENSHQCHICNKNFSSGQALGGHMRCHATGPSSQVVSPEEDIQSVREVLKFDLNEVPDTEDADGKNDGN